MGCRIVLDSAAGFVEIGLGGRVEELLGAVPLYLSIITNRSFISTPYKFFLDKEPLLNEISPAQTGRNRSHMVGLLAN